MVPGFANYCGLLGKKKKKKEEKAQFLLAFRPLSEKCSSVALPSLGGGGRILLGAGGTFLKRVSKQLISPATRAWALQPLPAPVLGV